MSKFTLFLQALLIIAVCLPAQALEPGDFPIIIYANEDYRLNLSHTANGQPIDLTGYSFKLQARKGAGTPAFLTFSSAVTNAAQGQTSHWLTRAATAANAKAAGTYDLMQTAPDGTVSYRMKGTIQIMETVTR